MIQPGVVCQIRQESWAFHCALPRARRSIVFLETFRNTLLALLQVLPDGCGDLAAKGRYGCEMGYNLIVKRVTPNWLSIINWENCMHPTRNQLNKLLAFLPAFEIPGRGFGVFRESEPIAEGQFSSPWIEYDPDVIRFIQISGQPCFTDIDYISKQPGQWLEDPEFPARADYEQCMTLLTFCIRADRFSEGSLGDDLKSGRIQRILRRIRELSLQMTFENQFILMGAIAGDVIGSVYEHNSAEGMDFPLFSDGSRLTDDSVLTLAVADAILEDGSYAKKILEYGRRYPHAGYGSSFRNWLKAVDPQPYNSFGNGSAMRVSPVGWAFDTLDEVLEQAKLSAQVTHNHPEGIKGAQAVALAVYMARTGASKEDIRLTIQAYSEYDLSRRLEEIRPNYRWDVTCQGSVPEAIIAFLESSDFESAIRNAISMGGDADTMAAIAGAIAEAYYDGVPQAICEAVLKRIPPELNDVLERFNRNYL